MDIRDIIESKCMGMLCCLMCYFNPPCCIPWCDGNCCLPYDEYLQSNDGKILRQACYEDNYSRVKLIIDKWKGVSRRSCCLINPLSEGGGGERLNSVHISALRGHLEILQILLDSNRVNVDQYAYYDYPYGFFSKFKHRTAIHLAVGYGHIKCLKLLIDHGANLKKPTYEVNSTCFTLLFNPFRVQLRPTEVSSMDMLSKKFIQDMATVKHDPLPSPVVLSTSTSTTVTTTCSPLSISAESKNSITISIKCCDQEESLVKKHHHPIPDYDACLTLLESHGFTFSSHIEYALETAFRYNNGIIFEVFSKRHTATNLVNAKHYLHRAIKQRRDLQMIHALIRSGVDVNRLDGDGKVAAFYACK